MKNYDVIIIGRGPAGLSASLYTSRSNLSTLVIGKESWLSKAAEVENYFGFPQPVSGDELLQNGLQQAKRLGVELWEGEVTSLSQQEDGFSAKLSDGMSCKGTSLLIATGQPRNRLNIPGLRDLEGKGISYCTTCDGFFYRNKRVGLLGSGEYALEEAKELIHFTKDITLFTNGKPLEDELAQAAKEFNFKIVTEKIVRIAGDARLHGVLLPDGKETELDGLFIASGTASGADFAAKMGIFSKDSVILTDENQQTNLPGVYAAGDCCAKLKQISVSVGQGAVAGQAMADYVRKAKSQKETVSASQ